MISTRSRAGSALAIGLFLSPALFAQDTVAHDLASPGGKMNRVVVRGQGPSPLDSANLIFSNGPLASSAGTGAGGADESVLQNVTLGMNTFGYGAQAAPAIDNRVADDFEVPNGQFWYVSEILLYAYQTGSSTTSTITGAYLEIFDGDPSLPASTVVFGDRVTNRLTSSVFSNTYRVSETSGGTAARPIMENTVGVGTLLGAGTYWLCYSFDGSLASGPWVPPIVLAGSSSTGDALQSLGGGAFATATDVAAGTPQGLPFQICGSVACCWETDYGADLALADDDIAPNLALGFTFPFAGGSTGVIDVCSNGFVSLGTGLHSADFSVTLAEFLNEGPRIGIPWDDFNPAESGSVHFNALPGRVVVTWLGVGGFQSPNTPDSNTFQLQLFPDGNFTIACCQHDATWQSSPICGISAGFGAPSVATDLTAGPFSSAGVGTVYEEFTLGGGSDLAGTLLRFRPDGSGGYEVAPGPACCTFAAATPYGAGCGGAVMTATSLPVLGQTAVLNTSSAPTTIAAVALIGIAQANFDLGPYGAPGCAVLHDNLFPWMLTALPSGDTFLAIPCLADLLGASFQFQGVLLDPAANTFGIATTNGLTLTVGNLE